MKRTTSWEDSPFPREGLALWRRHGLGDDDADLALYLLEKDVCGLRIWPCFCVVAQQLSDCAEGRSHAPSW